MSTMCFVMTDIFIIYFSPLFTHLGIIIPHHASNFGLDGLSKDLSQESNSLLGVSSHSYFSNNIVTSPNSHVVSCSSIRLWCLRSSYHCVSGFAKDNCSTYIACFARSFCSLVSNSLYMLLVLISFRPLRSSLTSIQVSTFIKWEFYIEHFLLKSWGLSSILCSNIVHGDWTCRFFGWGSPHVPFQWYVLPS